MKKIIIIVTYLICSFSSFAGDYVDIKINKLHCRSNNLLASVTYSGEYAGDSYMNISMFNRFGIPLSQQARLVGAYEFSEGVALELQVAGFPAVNTNYGSIRLKRITVCYECPISALLK